MTARLIREILQKWVLLCFGMLFHFQSSCPSEYPLQKQNKKQGFCLAIQKEKQHCKRQAADRIFIAPAA